jgi:hypothetical protein
MTVNRDKKLDVTQTNQLILERLKPKFNGESWLGHTKDCGIIDHELLNGATREELVKRSGRSPIGVDGHIQHLKSEHGLMISKAIDIYRLDYFHQKSNTSLSHEELKALMQLDCETVKNFCIVELEAKEGISKWYSIGVSTPVDFGINITSLNKDKTFAKSLIDKKVGDFVNFGAGFKLLSIKKYLSE